MTTADAARPSYFLFHGHAHECPYTVEGDWSVCDCGATRAESAETLAAAEQCLRVCIHVDGCALAATPAEEFIRGGAGFADLPRAATPAEGDYLTSREQKRLACVCGHPLIRHTEYGCIECGTSEVTTPQHNFTRKYAPTPAEVPRYYRCDGADGTWHVNCEHTAATPAEDDEAFNRKHGHYPITLDADR